MKTALHLSKLHKQTDLKTVLCNAIQVHTWEARFLLTSEIQLVVDIIWLMAEEEEEEKGNKH